jgi:glycosyltransferase involved in cell wall biosynthesis
MDNKLVSIIIPMYNAELYIGKMIDSILVQTYNFWELIIVDDNSTDNSCNIVRQYASLNDNIKLYVKNGNDIRGANPSRNIGTKLACGEYILYFDADDIITNYCISQRVTFMEENPQVDFAVFPAITFRNTAFDCTVNFGYKQDYLVMGHFLAGLLPFAVWTNIYRLSSLKAKGVIWKDDLPCLQDTVFNVLAISKGLQYKFSNAAPDYLWRFVGNMNSISRNIYTDKRLGTRIDVLNMFYHMNLGRRNDGALLLRSFYIYLSVINSNADNIYDKFFCSEAFKSHKILAYKLKLHYDLIKRYHITSRFILLSLLLISSPFYTFRGVFFNQIRKIRLNMLHFKLKRTYKNLVDKSVSY